MQCLWIRGLGWNRFKNVQNLQKIQIWAKQIMQKMLIRKTSIWARVLIGISSGVSISLTPKPKMSSKNNTIGDSIEGWDVSSACNALGGAMHPEMKISRVKSDLFIHSHCQKLLLFPALNFIIAICVLIVRTYQAAILASNHSYYLADRRAWHCDL